MHLTLAVGLLFQVLWCGHQGHQVSNIVITWCNAPRAHDWLPPDPGAVRQVSVMFTFRLDFTHRVLTAGYILFLVL
jgi:hypothetical protein